jgi:hypothetical protein
MMRGVSQFLNGPREAKVFCLTPALSRWEREFAVALEVTAAPGKQGAVVFDQSGVRFSLSQRERAGVRESACETQPVHF